MSVNVPCVCSVLEQINSQYSNKVARNVVLPIPHSGHLRLFNGSVNGLSQVLHFLLGGFKCL